MLDFVRSSLRLSQQATTGPSAAPSAAASSGRPSQAATPYFDPKGRSSTGPSGDGRRTADGRVSIARNLYCPDVEAARVRDSCAIDEEALEVESVLQKVCQQRLNTADGSSDADLFNAPSAAAATSNATGSSAVASAALHRFQPNLFARGRNTEALLLLKEHLLETIVTQQNSKTEIANLTAEVARTRNKSSALVVEKENLEHDIQCDRQHLSSLAAERAKELQGVRNVSYHAKQVVLEQTRDQEKLRMDIRRSQLESGKLEKMLGHQYMQNNNLQLLHSH